MKIDARTMGSLLLLAAKVLVVVLLMRGTVVPFLYQNF